MINDEGHCDAVTCCAKGPWSGVYVAPRTLRGLNKSFLCLERTQLVLRDSDYKCECDSIDDFDVNILECVKRPLDIALLEARWIRRKRPLLNRCHELTVW